MNQQGSGGNAGGGGSNNGFPAGINPQALQAALGQAQQQQQQGQSQMMGMGGSMNPALLSQQSSQGMPNNMPQSAGGGGGGGNDGSSSQPNMLPAGLSPQNGMAMLQALRSNMGNLQAQWSNVSSQPDSPAKQQEQGRLANEMRRMKAMHDQLVNMLRSQSQQAQMGRSQQGSQQPQTPATPQQANAPTPSSQQQPNQQPNQQGQGQQQRPSAQMQNQSSSGPMPGMNPFGQGGMGMGQGQGSNQNQGFPGTPGSVGGANGMPFGAGDIPQHQSQLAALQAFAQQQQQRQQQSQSQHHHQQQQQQRGPATPQSVPSSSHQQQQSQGLNPSGPPQQQQQQSQPPVTPSQPSALPPGLSNLSQFTAIISSFMSQRGTPFPPNVSHTFIGPAPSSGNNGGDQGTRNIELNALFASVIGMGGSGRLSSTTVPGASSNVPQALTGWIILANKLGLAVANPDPQGEGNREQVPTPAQTPERLRNWYRERLAPFEEWWMNKSRGAGQQSGQPSPASQPQQQQQQRPDGMPQQGYLGQQMMPGQQQQQPPPQVQMNQQSQHPPQTQGQGPSGSQEGKPGQQQPALNPAQQQMIQQLAHQLQRGVAEGKISSEDARNRFMQAQAAIRGQSQQQQQQQQQQQPQGPGMMMAAGTPGGQQQPPPQPQPQAGPSSEPAQAPTPAASTTSESTDQKGSSASKKRPRKSGGQAATPAGAGKAGKTSTPKMPKLEGPPGSGASGANDMKPHSRQGSVQAPGTPASGPAAMPPQTPSAAPHLTPKTAMRMLQQGNLNPAQQAAALAAVRAGSAQTNAQAQQAQRPPSSAGPQGQAPDAPPLGQQSMDGGPPHAQQQARQPSAPAPPPPVVHPPNKYKVEYLPLRRDVDTHATWNLDLVESELAPLARGYGKQPRSVRELGTVDISSLVFSLKSRLEIEVSFALNQLLVLSSGSGVRADAFHVSLAHCGDLVDELVGLLERSAFQEAGEDASAYTAVNGAEPPSFDIAGRSTHVDWVADALQEEEEAKMFKRVKHGRSGSAPTTGVREGELDTAGLDGLSNGFSYTTALFAEREKSRKADVALTVVDILRNFASMGQNVELLADHGQLLVLLGKLVERPPSTGNRSEDDSEEEQNARASSPHSHVFTTTELLRVRKDVLFILSSIAGPYLQLAELPVTTVASLFDLLCSFMVDGAAIEELAGLIYDYPPAPPPGPPGMPPPMRPAPVPWAARVPHYAEMALDSFARFAQPDSNRRLLSTLIPESTLYDLAQTLVRMLPCSDIDFSLFRTEARLAYTEHIAMCLYNVVFMASSRLKGKLRNGTAGWVGSVWRVIKRTARQGGQAAGGGSGGGGPDGQNFTQNPFSCLIYRLVETLKLVDEAKDMFDQHPSLAFAGQEDDGGPGAMGAGSPGEDARTRGGGGAKAPLLALEEMEVVNLLTTPGLDAVLVGHLSSMIAV